MDPLLLALGVALVVATVVDLLWTALWADGGAGPLTRTVNTLAWRALRRTGRGRSRTLGLMGPVVVTLTLFVWVGALWLGWTLVFAGDAGSLVDTRADEPVRWTGRLYFVAYSLFTMGNGDFSPDGGPWQVATSLTTASGMLFVTFGASYVISVMGAVAQKRAFATGVTGLGATPTAWLRAGAADGGLRALDPVLAALSSQLSTLTAQHRAYPVLHYYRSEGPEASSARAVAIFDEALTLARFGVAAEARPNPALLQTARSSVDGYLESLVATSIEPAETAPSPPDLSALGEALPLVDPAAFRSAVEGLAERRRQLRGVVVANRWPWPDDAPAA